MSDVGEGQKLSNRAFLEIMSDTANMHGRSIGQYSGARDDLHMAWVIMGWKLEVLRRPAVCEIVTGRTWAREYNRAFAYRDFEVVDEAGNLCARATSSWMLIDLNRNFPARLTPENMDPYQPEFGRANFPGYTFPRPAAIAAEAVSRVAVPILKSMIDANGHVHNTAYLDLAEEGLPEGESAMLSDSIEVLYVHELKRGQTARVEYAPSDGKKYVFIRDDGEGGLHAVIALS